MEGCSRDLLLSISYSCSNLICPSPLARTMWQCVWSSAWLMLLLLLRLWLLTLQLQLLSLSVHKSCEISHFAHFRFVLTSVTYAHRENNRLQQVFICVFSSPAWRRMLLLLLQLKLLLRLASAVFVAVAVALGSL